MKKHLLYTAFIGSFLNLTAQQNFSAQLDSIQDEVQAAQFIASHKENKGTLYVFNKEKHKTQLAQDLFKMGKGGSKVIATDLEKTHYKVIDKYEVPNYRVSYVYFDGKKKSPTEIKDLQQRVILKYNQGFKFKDLAKEYSMDTNATRGGDLGWFTKGAMASEFETAVTDPSRSLGSIFALDLPEQQWYYVILKTHAPKMIEEIKVLAVTEFVK